VEVGTMHQTGYEVKRKKAYGIYYCVPHAVMHSAENMVVVVLFL
jgi:hypothetical protein